MKREDLLDLNEAVQNPGRELVFQISTELQHEEDLDLLEPVTGEIRTVSTGNILLLKGDFQTRCVMECARCASPLEIPVSYHMEDDFPVEGIPACYGAEGYAHIEAEDEPYPLFSKNALVRDAWVRQGLIVNLPVQALCPFGWDGPCPNAAKTVQAKTEVEGHPGLKRLGELRLEPKEPEV